MPPNLASRLAIGAALSVLLLAGPGVTGPFDSATNQGPSSSQTPYLVPVIPGARSTSLLTVGDSVPRDGGGDPYRMVGIPDGIGAFDNGNGTITVLMNHEIPAANGVPRGSGGTGAFVSKWTVDKNSLQVLSGRDLVTTPANLHVESGSINLDRLCSADLPALSAFYNAATGLGYNGRIYMNGEERTGTGRAFGWVVAENAAYELPKLGKFAHENEVASPHSGNTTLVMGMDDTRGPSDTAGSKIWAYVGTKTDTGSAIDKAGLTNGQSYAIAVQGATSEDRTGDIGVGKDGSKQFTLVDPSTGTNFLRPEDGAWDTKDPNRFYFVTTDRYDETKDGVGTQIGRSRLWSITFDDVTDPLKGGKIELLLDGTEPQQMFDNITVDAAGNVYLQEDPVTRPITPRSGSTTRTPALTEIFKHDVARFGDIGLPPTPPFNQDEETSGIIDVTDLFRDASWYRGGRIFLADAQAHYPIPGELVEGGQLLLLQVVPEPGSAALILSALVGFRLLRRRRNATPLA